MIIAVDFDGTLCKDDFPNIGVANNYLIDLLKYRKEMGDKLILWTCREGDYLIKAVTWCAMYGLTFDAVNDNVPENMVKHGVNCRKIVADIYIDDRAMQPNEFNFKATFFPFIV